MNYLFIYLLPYTVQSLIQRISQIWILYVKTLAFKIKKMDRMGIEALYWLMINDMMYMVCNAWLSSEMVFWEWEFAMNSIHYKRCTTELRNWTFWTTISAISSTRFTQNKNSSLLRSNLNVIKNKIMITNLFFLSLLKFSSNKTTVPIISIVVKVGRTKI